MLTRVVLPGSVPMVLTGLWLAWQVLRVDRLVATLTLVAALGVSVNAALRWLARRGAPWLSEREATI